MRGRTGERSRRRGARQACAIRDLLEVRGFILSAPPARLFGLGAFSYEPPPGAARLRFGSRPGACVIKRAFGETYSPPSTLGAPMFPLVIRISAARAASPAASARARRRRFLTDPGAVCTCRLCAP